MKIKTNLFEEYYQSLNEEDREHVHHLLLEVDRHNTLPRKERVLLRKDFEQALLTYQTMKVPLSDALLRLDPKNMGGFYARPPLLWYSLDDAAKIYPLSIRHGQMAVFRLSAYLKLPIIPAILQIALTFCIKRFPSFATTVKKGFFWHYLNASKRRYKVEAETDVPCQPLIISQSGSPSFRVLYYQQRISIEFFHILTDGAGGMLLLKTLVREYLRLLGVSTKESTAMFDINEIPHLQETDNAFNKNELPKKAAGFMDKTAVQLSGKIAKIKPCRIVHYKIDTTQLKQVTKQRNTSVTAYLLALVFVASKYAIEEVKGSVNIHVPVDMRQYYPSKTIRNFSMYCGIRLPVESILDVDGIIAEVSTQLKEKSAQEPMSKMMRSTTRMVRSLRYIPLFVKAPIASIIYGFLSDSIFTNTLSNLGIVTLPKELEDYVESLDFILGPGIINRAKCSVVTYRNITTFSVSKLTMDPSFEEKLFDLLRQDGLQPVLEGSDIYES